MFPEYYPQPLSPAFVNARQHPVNRRRDIAEQRVGGRMNVQRGGDQEQQRLLGRELVSGEVSEALKFAASLVPDDPRPVIQPLERQMDDLVGLEFDDSQAP